MSGDGLEGKTALVTGASRGIGEACARALARSGARVVLSARDGDRLKEIASGLPHRPEVVVADLSEPGSAARLLGDVTERVGNIDILVNNAGLSMLEPTGSLTDEDLTALFQVNQTSALVLAARTASSMADNGGGSIVTVSSAAGTRGSPWLAAYSATKGAADAWTRALATEWGPKGVRVNAVAPGIIRTDMWEAGLAIDAVEDWLTSNTPLRRIGTPEDVAGVVVFLSSDAADFVTGQVLRIDGGFSDGFELLPHSVTGR
ncbi:MAG TPA: SDR family oxidoreductase [Acidimicrobiales bacterium]|jgi:NAD(P)-dependent dehydrogenase (short-subunit alcohol dehydrogenase family)